MQVGRSYHEREWEQYEYEQYQQQYQQQRQKLCQRWQQQLEGEEEGEELVTPNALHLLIGEMEASLGPNDEVRHVHPEG